MTKPNTKGLLYFVLLVLAVSCASAVTLDELLGSIDYSYSSGDLTVTSYSDAGVDTNSNTLFDIHQVDVNVNVNTAGNYTFVGKLFTDELKSIAETNVILSTGANTIKLNFSSDEIKETDYNLSLSVFLDEQSALTNDSAHTISVNPAQYESLITITSLSSSLLDVDADPDNEYLNVSFSINVSTTKDYAIEGYLYDNQSAIQAKETYSLTAGLNEVSLLFESEKIKEKRFDGQFLLTTINVDGKQYDVDYTTAVYSLSNFEQGDAIFTSFDDSGADYNQDNLYEYLKVNATVDINQAGSYQIKISLVDLYGEAVDEVELTRSYTVGTHEVTVPVMGSVLCANKISGPYKIASIELLKDNVTLVDKLINPYTTQEYYYDEFLCKDKPDLTITSVNMTHIMDDVYEVTATVNSGPSFVFNTLVSFYDDEFNLIRERSIGFIPPFEERTITLPRINASELTKLITYVDFYDTIEETNESNNILEKYMQVLPTITASKINATAPALIQFNGSAVGNSPFNYYWDFNSDGIVDSTTQNAEYNFAVSGNYVVTLNVTDIDNNFGIATENIYVNSSDIVSITSFSPELNSEGPVGYNQTFSITLDLGTNPFPTIKWYEDGWFILIPPNSTSSWVKPTESYLAWSPINITAVVESQGKEVDRIEWNYSIVPDENTSVEFTTTPSTGFYPLTVQFNSTILTGNKPFTYSWDFDNDAVVDSTEKNPQHEYTTGGNYIVSLIVTDIDGDTNLTRANIFVDTPVTITSVNASPLSGLTPLDVQFNATGTGDLPLTYLWDFDNDGTVDSTTQNPQYIYTAPGTYTAVVNISDNDEDSQTQSVEIVVGNTLVTAEIAADPLTGLIPLLVLFNATGTGDLPLTYSWDFNNDGTVDSITKNPQHTYTAPGTYTVVLNISDVNGDSSKDTVEIIVIQKHAPQLNLTGTTIDEGQKLEIQASATDENQDTITYFLTDEPTGMTIDQATGLITWQTDYDNSGSYTITVTASNGELTDSQDIEVIVNDVQVADILIESSSIYWPKSPKADDWVMLEVVLKNIGEIAADNIIWYLSTGSSDEDTSNTNNPITLDIGDKITVYPEFQYSSSGNYNSNFTVGNNNPELDKTNNNVIIPITVG